MCLVFIICIFVYRTVHLYSSTFCRPLPILTTPFFTDYFGCCRASRWYLPCDCWSWQCRGYGEKEQSWQAIARQEWWYPDSNLTYPSAGECNAFWSLVVSQWKAHVYSLHLNPSVKLAGPGCHWRPWSSPWSEIPDWHSNPWASQRSRHCDEPPWIWGPYWLRDNPHWSGGQLNTGQLCPILVL